MLLVENRPSVYLLRIIIATALSVICSPDKIFSHLFSRLPLQFQKKKLIKSFCVKTYAVYISPWVKSKLCSLTTKFLTSWPQSTSSFCFLSYLPVLHSHIPVVSYSHYFQHITRHFQSPYTFFSRYSFSSSPSLFT